MRKKKTAEKTKVSVIICVYNAERTIGETLACVFGSTLPVSYEVIVVDDASTDSTADICEEYNVRMVRLTETQGPARARNIGVRESKGEIILFLDSDVTFASDLLGRMLDRMRLEPDLAGVGSISSPVPLNPGFYSRYFALQEFYRNTRGLDSEGGSRESRVCTRCGTLKRSVFDELGGFSEKHKTPSIEDYQFSLRLRSKYSIHRDRTLVDNHRFPDTLAKIWKRYHKNTKEMYEVLRELRVKDTGPFREDIRARLFIGMAGIFCLGSLLLPRLLIIGLILLVAAMFVRRRLLKLFYQSEGLVFSIKGWLVYMVTFVPIGTGLLAGMISWLSGMKKK
jgi:glycosyltransferase involved in cell wall biosynthesis